MMILTITRSLRILPCLIIAASAVATGTEFYVAPNGSSSNNGSLSSPWDIRTAFSHPSSVRPGDTIWLRGGNYVGTFESRLNGSSAAPIKVRQYPGERAILLQTTNVNITTLLVRGSWTYYWGFEIMNSNPVRTISTSGSNPPDRRGAAVDNMGTNTKFINMVIHDNGQGIGSWIDAVGAELYGNIIFYNGWDAPDRGHGHGTYLQNETGRQYVTDNIVFANFGEGLRTYATNGRMTNITFDGNFSFNNGSISSSIADKNLLYGGSGVARGGVINNNYTYTALGGEINLGYGDGCAGMTLTNNYFIGGTALHLVYCSFTQITGNTLYGSLLGLGPGTYPGNTYFATRPTGTKIAIRPNRFESGRANIAVYNWDLRTTVPVDVTGILNPGDPYEVRDVQNFLGAPVLTGTYAGGSINLPMMLSTITPPVGAAPRWPAHTSPEFNAFVLMKTGTGTSTPPPPAGPVNTAPSANAGQDQAVTLPAQAMLSGSASDDGLPNGSLTYTWSRISGPGSVNFGSVSAASTSASFSMAGTYVLRLTASDGALSDTDDVTVNAVDPSSSVYQNYEAESASLTWPMQIMTDSRASQQRYITSTTPNGTAALTFAVPATGNYAIWLRLIAPSFGQDSIGVGLEGVTGVFDAMYGRWSRNWSWARIALHSSAAPESAGTPQLFYLTAGNHTLTLTEREQWVPIDRILITNDLNFDPATGASLPPPSTPPPPPSAPPVISNVAGAPSGTSAVITWSTDVASDSQVEYGATTGYGNSTAINTALVTAHSVTISGLTPGSIYQFRVKSRSSAGLTTSGNFSVTIPQPNPPSSGSGPVRIYVEAESGQFTAPMTSLIDAQASGRTYISTPMNNTGSVRLTFNVPVAGTYYLWGRVVAPSFNQNSFTIAIDGGPADTWDAALYHWSRYWQWSRINGRGGSSMPNTIPIRVFSLSAGQHTLTVGGGKAWTALDQFMFTTDIDTNP